MGDLLQLPDSGMRYKRMVTATLTRVTEGLDPALQKRIVAEIGELTAKYFPRGKLKALCEGLDQGQIAAVTEVVQILMDEQLKIRIDILTELALLKIEIIKRDFDEGLV